MGLCMAFKAYMRLAFWCRALLGGSLGLHCQLLCCCAAVASCCPGAAAQVGAVHAMRETGANIAEGLDTVAAKASGAVEVAKEKLGFK